MPLVSLQVDSRTPGATVRWSAVVTGVGRPRFVASGVIVWQVLVGAAIGLWAALGTLSTAAATPHGRPAVRRTGPA